MHCGVRDDMELLFVEMIKGVYVTKDLKASIIGGQNILSGEIAIDEIQEKLG